MRTWIWTCVALVLLLGIVGWSYGGPQSATGDAVFGADRGLITHSFAGGGTGDHLVIIDPVTRVMAVYRVHREHGEIALVSARKIQWDLQLLDFNSQRPLPEEIRAGLQRQSFE